MVYLWRVPDGYPQSLIGQYQREATLDRFLLKKGERLFGQVETPTIKFNGMLAQLRQFDCLANSALVPLVNEKCAAILTEVAPSDVQLVAAQVEAADGGAEEFSLVNITCKVQAIDRGRSVFSYVPGTQQIMSFRRLEYVESCLGEHALARDAEYLGHLLVAEPVAMRLKREGCKGIELLKPSEIAW
jgi:hypothetical protein